MLHKKFNKSFICSTAILFMLFALAGIVYAVNCWMFEFSGSRPYPNPAGVGTQVKETMNLCVLGDDFQLYPAVIRSVVYNKYSGQKVYERTEEHSSSPSFQMVVWIVGDDVASGSYTIKTRAESSLCGNSAWDVRSITILN